mmetsp:Transcript_13081/g.42642  ORF Transcript_13081/g.42642 Transcript_13081/m.42642 type:complete len:85 (+) Transcript_13081:471-725(+)
MSVGFAIAAASLTLRSCSGCTCVESQSGPFEAFPPKIQKVRKSENQRNRSKKNRTRLGKVTGKCHLFPWTSSKIDDDTIRVVLG